MLHRDVNRYNFLLGDYGTKMIDFETARVGREGAAMKKELEGLHRGLTEEEEALLHQ
ncbi:hypothetical protein K440DRAFT_623854 [Wilcoxina mikolae CBS 423.85]|nr:hypothetical protein K440DRAFT_623854 [Wilcoxina mikolae CBS 423.85]